MWEIFLNAVKHGESVLTKNQ